jgi:hypothetical protein
VVRANDAAIENRAERKFRATMRALISPRVNFVSVVPEDQIDAEQPRGIHLARS